MLFHESCSRKKTNYIAHPTAKNGFCRCCGKAFDDKDIVYDEMWRYGHAKGPYVISEDLTSHDTVGFWEGFNYVSQLIDSAPTVETLEDILASLPLNFNMSRNYSGDYCIAVGDWDEGGNLHRPFAQAKTPFEAVKKLEEVLNNK